MATGESTLRPDHLVFSIETVADDNGQLRARLRRREGDTPYSCGPVAMEVEADGAERRRDAEIALTEEEVYGFDLLSARVFGAMSEQLGMALAPLPPPPVEAPQEPETAAAS